MWSPEVGSFGEGVGTLQPRTCWRRNARGAGAPLQPVWLSNLQGIRDYSYGVPSSALKVWLVEHLEALLLADQPDARATANGGDSLGEFCLSGLQLHKVGREVNRVLSR